MIAYILLALGLVLLIEGLVYALAPSFLEQMLEMLRRIPEAALRQLGALAVVVGLILVWLAFQLGF